MLLDFGEPVTTPTMAKKLTHLLLIALMLVVPLRALAGVAMACPMGSEAMQMQHAIPGEMPSGHCQDMQHGQGDMDQQHAQGGCNLCADCCLGSASVPVAVRFASFDKSRSPLISLFDLAYSGFQPEGPERPPRSSAL
jgi:hypothetical protein